MIHHNIPYMVLVEVNYKKCHFVVLNIVNECVHLSPIMDKIRMIKMLTKLCVSMYLLADKHVTPPTLVREFPGSITGSGKNFYVCSFCFVVVFIFLLSKNIIIIKFCNSFCNGNSFSIRHILQFFCLNECPWWISCRFEAETLAHVCTTIAHLKTYQHT